MNRITAASSHITPASSERATSTPKSKPKQRVGLWPIVAAVGVDRRSDDRCPDGKSLAPPTAHTKPADKGTELASILANVSRSYLRRTLRFLSEKPHLSGTKYSEETIVDFIADEFRKNGLDTVEKVPYRVLHQYPDPNNPNKVQLVDANGKVLEEAKLTEDLVPGDNVDGLVPGYLSYARPGTVEVITGDQTQLQGTRRMSVYIGSGTHGDVDMLEANGIFVKGRICLARYGGGHRGGKVTVCQERGGMARHCNVGLCTHFADVETPGYPSVDGVYRDINSSELPKIPALTVNYNFAKKVLDQMQGKVVNLSGGARPAGPIKDGRKLRLTVNSKWARPVVYDIIGTVRGRLEPDRYSITGAHHDAWVYGTIDPSSSTANILELSRLLGHHLKRGWRPRRTVVLAIWAAEETAIAGSGEWVEEKLLRLNRGGVGLRQRRQLCLRDHVFRLRLACAEELPRGYNQTCAVQRHQDSTELKVYLTHGGMDNSAFNFVAGEFLRLFSPSGLTRMCSSWALTLPTTRRSRRFVCSRL
ncbi:hypothetical protein MRX96_007322 [Rhipicephalus microplus]